MPQRSSSDEILMKAVKNGDSEAYNILFERHWQPLYTTIFAVSKDREVCSEIIHDIFLNLWLKRERLDIGSFKGYIIASARYHVYRYVKNAKRNSVEYLDDLDSADPISLNQGELNIRSRELQASLNERMSRLPKRCKEIFTLSRVDQLSNDEIAQRLEISKRSVENQLTYALQHLRVSLKDIFMLCVTYSVGDYFL
jgi:RNA polymerase sigma factor (sigma-70 family)